jgi:hypothetical protein
MANYYHMQNDQHIHIKHFFYNIVKKQSLLKKNK